MLVVKLDVQDLTNITVALKMKTVILALQIVEMDQLSMVRHVILSLWTFQVVSLIVQAKHMDILALLHNIIGPQNAKESVEMDSGLKMKLVMMASLAIHQLVKKIAKFLKKDGSVRTLPKMEPHLIWQDVL